MVTPKLHTSLLLENLRKLIHSGAYHFSGHFPAVRAYKSRAYKGLIIPRAWETATQTTNGCVEISDGSKTENHL